MGTTVDEQEKTGLSYGQWMWTQLIVGPMWVKFGAAGNISMLACCY